ncbi:hypothetical protein ACFVYC_21745 [Pseudarthrobacter sp. NPDC058329]|uniref:hypothetical protein n=1 Tax=Pseudarthrobacter sp. NPDC058329 TaxID=3346448 RepID=UPI0036DC388E
MSITECRDGAQRYEQEDAPDSRQMRWDSRFLHDFGGDEYFAKNGCLPARNG